MGTLFERFSRFIVPVVLGIVALLLPRLVKAMLCVKTVHNCTSSTSFVHTV